MLIRSILLAIAILVCVPFSGLARQGFYADLKSRDFDVVPGQQLSGSIDVTSLSDEPITLRVFSAVQVRGGEAGQDYEYVEGVNDEPRSLLSWLTFSPNELTLQPKETRPVLFEVNVPNDASLSGSYWATILIANEPTAEQVIQQTQNPETATVGIKFVFRYAIRVSATFPPPHTIEGTMTAVDVEVTPESIRMLPVFENKGNVILKPKVWLDVKDLTGKTVARTEPKTLSVLPESKRILVTTLEDTALPAGEYFITVAADYGGPKPVGARAKVVLEQPLVPKPKEDAEALGVEDLPPGIPAPAPEDAPPGAADNAADGDAEPQMPAEAAD